MYDTLQSLHQIVTKSLLKQRDFPRIDFDMSDVTPPLPAMRRHWRWLVIIGSLCWLALMGSLRVQSFVPVAMLTRDPATIAQHPPYYGALSNLSILLWSACAAVCFLSAAVLKILRARTNQSAFFTTFAWLNTVLCLDDTYLLHEAILPNRLPLIRIPEVVVVGTYAGVLVCAIVYFWPLLRGTQLWLFGLSLLFFGVAAGLDQVIPAAWEFADTTFWVEDGLKLLAIFLWLAYFCRASLEFTAQQVSRYD